MKALAWIRQGDVAFVQGTMLGDRWKTEKGRVGKRLVVAEGEVTGHAHILVGDLTFDREHEPTYVKVAGVATLTHEEHGTVEIPEGVWQIVRQREFWGEERRVMD